MSRLLLVAAFAVTCSSLFAQIFPEGYVTERAYLSPGSVKGLTKRERREMTNEKRLLFAIYKNIEYPRFAIEGGVGATIKVSYTIDTLGQATTTGLAYFDGSLLDSLQTNSAPVVVTAFGGNPSFSKGMYTNEQIDKAGEQIARECGRVINELPRFAPARFEGNKVKVSSEQYFTFRCE